MILKILKLGGGKKVEKNFLLLLHILIIVFNFVFRK